MPHAHDFPTLYAEAPYEDVMADFQIERAPTLVVLDRRGRLAYRGGFATSPYILAHNLDRIVDHFAGEAPALARRTPDGN
jgi:hypothetical protein